MHDLTLTEKEMQVEVCIKMTTIGLEYCTDGTWHVASIFFNEKSSRDTESSLSIMISFDYFRMPQPCD